jgi:hypothetical protein
MTALTDIQRSLNAIRAIERDSSADVRLAALALLAATTADIAKELRGVNAPKQPPKQPIKAPPIPLQVQPINRSKRRHNRRMLLDPLQSQSSNVSQNNI